LGSISESAKPAAIAAIEAATFQALVPVVAAAANFGPTAPTQGANPNLNQGQNQTQNDPSSQSTSSTGSQSSGSSGSGGSSGAADKPADKPVTVALTPTTTPTDTAPTGQTNTTPTTTGTTTPITTVVTPDSTPHITPTGTTTNVSDTETASAQAGGFDIMSHVSVANPGSPTGYVNGSGTLVSATLSAGVPAALTTPAFLASLVSVDSNGTVHYDNSKFSFLAAGQSLSYTIAFD